MEFLCPNVPLVVYGSPFDPRWLLQTTHVAVAYVANLTPSPWGMGPITVTPTGCVALEYVHADTHDSQTQAFSLDGLAVQFAPAPDPCLIPSLLSLSFDADGQPQSRHSALTVLH